MASKTSTVGFFPTLSCLMLNILPSINIYMYGVDTSLFNLVFPFINEDILKTNNVGL